MDKLPVEMLSAIFFYLHFEQKLKCKLVCRCWARTIRLGGMEIETVKVPLYRECIFYAEPSHFFIQNAPNKNGCRRLSLHQFHNKAKLAALFPKLKFLAFFPEEAGTGEGLGYTRNRTVEYIDDFKYRYDPVKGKPIGYTHEQIQQLGNWHNNLETLVDISFSKGLFVFLDTGIFLQLTTLVLTPVVDIFLQEFDLLFHKLKNTPHLKSLHLSKAPINLICMEKLHQNVPLLETLRLNDFSLNGFSGRKLLQIQSKAISMKNLEIDFSKPSPRFSIGFLEYILFKYPYLQEFKLVTPNCGDNNDWKTFFKQFLYNTKDTLTLLKTDIRAEALEIIDSLFENGVSSLRALDVNLLHDYPLPRNKYVQQELQVYLQHQLEQRLDIQQNLKQQLVSQRSLKRQLQLQENYEQQQLLLQELQQSRHYNSNTLLQTLAQLKWIQEQLQRDHAKENINLQYEIDLDMRFHALMHFVEASNINSLSLNDVPAIDFNIFKKLCNLKELKLAFRHSPIYIAVINTIIKDLPDSLETLSLSNMHVCLVEEEEEEEEEIPFKSGIRRLELLDCQVKSNLSNYFWNHLLKLKEFILKSTGIDFKLQLRHLSLVDIHLIQGTYKVVRVGFTRDVQISFVPDPLVLTVGNTTYLYESPDDKTTRWVQKTTFKELFDTHDHSMYYIHKPSNRALANNESYFHFQCESVQTFLYNGFLLLV